MTLLNVDYSNLRRVILEALVIVCSGILLGLTFNYPLVGAVFKGELPPPPSREVPLNAERLPVPASLADVRDATPDTVLVDARIAELFNAGHLPGALSLPLAEIDSRLDAFTAHIPTDRPLIIYCNGYGCPDSFDLGQILLQQGYQQVMVFEGGVPEWRDAGFAIERGEP